MNNKILLALVMTAAATMAPAANAKKPVAAKHAAPREPEVVAVDVPPPSGTWEAKMAPANGHIWSTGYFEWKDAHYVWKPGEWVLAKEGMTYRQHKWMQRPDGKWILTGGDWVATQDGVAGKQ